MGRVAEGGWAVQMRLGECYLLHQSINVSSSTSTRAKLTSTMAIYSKFHQVQAILLLVKDPLFTNIGTNVNVFYSTNRPLALRYSGTKPRGLQLKMIGFDNKTQPPFDMNTVSM